MKLLPAYLLLLLPLSLFSCKPTVSGTGPLYDTATIRYTQQIADDSTKAQPYYLRGVVLRRMLQDSLALNDFRKAQLLDSSHAEYFSAAGNVLFDHKDISGSLPLFQKAIRINPADPQSHLKVATVLLFTKDYNKAFAEINSVLRQDAYNPEGYFLKGMIYKNTGDTAHAISSFQTALNVRPNYRDAALQLGLLFAAQKNALGPQYLETAFAMDTTDVLPLYAAGLYYQKQEQYEDAKHAYARARRYNRAYADAWYGAGYVLIQQDSAAAAIPYFDAAIQLEPENGAALFNRGLAKELSGDARGAAADYRTLLTANPQDAALKAALHRAEP